MRTTRDRLVPVVALLLGALQVAGCQDVREAADLRRAAVDRFGWTRVEIGVFPGEDRVEVTVSEPDSGASTPDETTARAMARLARDHYRRARRADSVEVSFVVSEGSDAGAVRVTRSRRYTFAADSI